MFFNFIYFLFISGYGSPWQNDKYTTCTTTKKSSKTESYNTGTKENFINLRPNVHLIKYKNTLTWFVRHSFGAVPRFRSVPGDGVGFESSFRDFGRLDPRDRRRTVYFRTTEPSLFCFQSCVLAKKTCKSAFRLRSLVHCFIKSICFVFFRAKNEENFSPGFQTLHRFHGQLLSRTNAAGVWDKCAVLSLFCFSFCKLQKRNVKFETPRFMNIVIPKCIISFIERYVDIVLRQALASQNGL